MTVIKKIKLSPVERNLDSIVLLCSKIKACQDEVKCLEEGLEDNKNEFSSGLLSKKIYTVNKSRSEREKRKLTKQIDLNIKRTLKKLDDLEMVLKQLEI